MAAHAIDLCSDDEVNNGQAAGSSAGGLFDCVDLCDSDDEVGGKATASSSSDGGNLAAVAPFSGVGTMLGGRLSGGLGASLAREREQRNAKRRKTEGFGGGSSSSSSSSSSAASGGGAASHWGSSSSSSSSNNAGGSPPRFAGVSDRQGPIFFCLGGKGGSFGDAEQSMVHLLREAGGSPVSPLIPGSNDFDKNCNTHVKLELKDYDRGAGISGRNLNNIAESLIAIAKTFPGRDIYLAGFSFGARLAVHYFLGKLAQVTKGGELFNWSRERGGIVLDIPARVRGAICFGYPVANTAKDTKKGRDRAVPLLAQNSHPVLIVTGKNDSRRRVGVFKEFAKKQEEQGSVLLEVDDVGHDVFRGIRGDSYQLVKDTVSSFVCEHASA